MTAAGARLPVAETSYSSWDPIRATRQNQDIQREVEDTAMMDIQVSRQQCAGYRGVILCAAGPPGGQEERQTHEEYNH